MNTPRKNSRSRGARDADDRRGDRGRSAPRGERGNQNDDNTGKNTRRDGGAARRGQGGRSSAGRGSAGRGGGSGTGGRGTGGGPSGRGTGGTGGRRAGQGEQRPGRQQGGGGRERDPVRRAESSRGERSTGRGGAPDRGGSSERSERGRPTGDRKPAPGARGGARGAGRGAAAGSRGEGQRSERSSSRVYTRREEGGGFRAGGRRPAARDFRDSRVPRGGGAAERDLSPAARARLNTLRSEYDPGDEESPGDDRDAYTGVDGGIRLQKALAQAGVASRRASEELIVAGRVTVDGHTVRRFGARVDPESSEIRVDGMLVAVSPDRRYFALHKPRGVVSTMSDPEGRPTLADYTGNTEERLFHVGRLDTETEGLILLTNDGELANRLTHPRYGVVKTYLAKVPGPFPREALREVRAGVELDDGPVEIDSFRIVENGEPQALVEIKLHEGRKHIVRRLLEAVGYPVTDLARTQIGPVGINNLKPGTMRALTAGEVSELYTAAGM
ncbi:pseudouridine synthase [Streptomonospora litoralis]|uniref:Pseudouridine synthase n=1 Tax=Streptomonospora litoralis TaxID=2498135 RepID=A0A4P6Q0F0_9ACTN|nr:pseudouridine synthase [Streptomonospora litoralis]QBI54008.1 Ribosomal large subunit pseudouridine synthase B [Streptomonospora litoralis]